MGAAFDGHIHATPRLSFACEVDAPHLTALFAQGTVIDHLQALGARVALTLADLSDARAAVVQRRNCAGIPVVGIPLLSLEDGYYSTPDHTRRAEERYQELKVWTARHAWQENQTITPCSSTATPSRC